MPFYDERPQVSDLVNLPKAAELAEADQVAPTTGETWGAAFRSINTVSSFLSSQGAADPYRIEDGFDPIDYIKDDDRYVPYAEEFAGVTNRQAADAIKLQIDQEQADRRTLAASGPMGVVASLAAGIFDLPTLLPLGSLFSVGRSVAVTGRSLAATTALASAADAAITETALHATQRTRTAEESAINIGGSVVLGGLLGAGAGTLLRQADQQRISRLLQDAHRPDFDAATDALHVEVSRYALGAAAARSDTIEDLTIAGKGASAVAKVTAGMNPVLRTLTSPSKAVRSIASRLMETPVYLRKNLSGEGDIAAETAMHEFARGGVVQAMEAQRRAFLKARTDGVAITEQGFREAVGKAMRRNDKSDIPGVAEAARAWRAHVIDPLKDRAIAAGLLPEDVTVSTAASYFSRVYNRPLIEANEAEFRGIVRAWLSRSLDTAIARRTAEASGFDETARRAAFDFVSDADRRAYLDEIVDDIYAKITGKTYDGAVPGNIVVTKRGPLKERTFNIPDALIEKFLESDVELVGRRYARMMAADIELTTRFGSPDMDDAIRAIRAEYADLRRAVSDPKQSSKLNDRERADIRDIEGVRDMLRGHYRPEIQHTTWARIGRAANTFNYMTAMGGVIVSSLTDAVRPAMVHGLRAYTNGALVPLIKNISAVKLSMKEAKLAGAISERLLASRLATLAEITDPYSINSPFERFCHSALASAGHSHLHRTGH